MCNMTYILAHILFDSELTGLLCANEPAGLEHLGPARIQWWFPDYAGSEQALKSVSLQVVNTPYYLTVANCGHGAASYKGSCYPEEADNESMTLLKAFYMSVSIKIRRFNQASEEGDEPVMRTDSDPKSTLHCVRCCSFCTLHVDVDSTTPSSEYTSQPTIRSHEIMQSTGLDSRKETGNHSETLSNFACGTFTIA